MSASAFSAVLSEGSQELQRFSKVVAHLVGGRPDPITSPINRDCERERKQRERDGKDTGPAGAWVFCAAGHPAAFRCRGSAVGDAARNCKEVFGLEGTMGCVRYVRGNYLIINLREPRT